MAGMGALPGDAKRVDLFVVIFGGLSNRFVYERFNFWHSSDFTESFHRR